MIQLWSLIANVERAEAVHAVLDRAGVPLLRSDDRDDGIRVGFEHYQPQLYTVAHRRDLIAARPGSCLDIPADWPDVDYVMGGIELVSRRLRDVLQLGEDDVVYGTVECSSGPARAREAGYMSMDLLQIGLPVDWERSVGAPVYVLDPGGGWVEEWRPRVGFGPHAPASFLYWRDDFMPPAPAFHVPGLSMTLVTEELASRVMRAGITDVEFLDVSGPQTPGDMRLRR